MAHRTRDGSAVTHAGRRVFLADVDLQVTNLSNHQREGTSVATLRGRFMGSGATLVEASAKPL